MQYREIESHFFAIPNGGSRPKKMVKTKTGLKWTSVEAGIMKMEGVKAGVADLLLLYPNEKYSFLAIEMKTKTGKQNDNQKAWQKNVEKLGIGKYVICRSFDEFSKEVKDYLQSTKFGFV
jgi:hypothetical protein